MKSRIVVLGGCGAWPEPGRACSGFLLEHAGFRVALDLGYGTLSRLLALLGSNTAAGLDAVVATHHHPDHVVDLHGLFRARLYVGQQLPRIGLYAPEAVLDSPALAPLWQPLPAGGSPAFRWKRPAPLRAQRRRAAFGPSSPWPTPRTGPDPALAEIGRNADLYIVDATDRYQRAGIPPDPDPSMNLTARQAGEAATAAGAHKLMLTHFWPGNDRDDSRAAAAEAFSGEILIADEGTVVDLP